MPNVPIVSLYKSLWASSTDGKRTLASERVHSVSDEQECADDADHRQPSKATGLDPHHDQAVATLGAFHRDECLHSQRTYARVTEAYCVC